MLSPLTVAVPKSGARVMRRAWNGPPIRVAVGVKATEAPASTVPDRSGALPATWKVKVTGADSPPTP
ncbi:hypothetical protein D3C87_1363150 [compost metagenome]